MSWVREYTHQAKAADELLAKAGEPDEQLSPPALQLAIASRHNYLLEAQVRATLALAAAVLLAAEDDRS